MFAGDHLASFRYDAKLIISCQCCIFNAAGDHRVCFIVTKKEVKLRCEEQDNHVICVSRFPSNKKCFCVYTAGQSLIWAAPLGVCALTVSLCVRS